MKSAEGDAQLSSTRRYRWPADSCGMTEWNGRGRADTRGKRQSGITSAGARRLAAASLNESSGMTLDKRSVAMPAAATIFYRRQHNRMVARRRRK